MYSLVLCVGNRRVEKFLTVPIREGTREKDHCEHLKTAGIITCL